MNRILVIDDEVVNLRLIKSMIHIGFPDVQVILCDKARDSISFAEREMPDVILLDLIMPDINGYEVCRQLKSNEKTKAIPVIMVSAIGQDPSVRVEGLRQGADAFLTKPVYLNELKEVIQVAFRHKVKEEHLQRENMDLERQLRMRTEEFHKTESRFLEISAYDIQFFWEVDSRGRVIYISSAAEKILGFPTHEMIGKGFLSFFQERSEKNRIKNLVFSYIKNRTSFRGEEYVSSRKDGTAVWMSVSGFPVFDGQNNYLGYRGINHDITLRKKVESELLKSLREIDAYKEKLKVLNSALTLAEEKERRRIAELLHDNLGPTLSLANLKITSALNKTTLEEAKKQLVDCTLLIQDTISQSRSLTYELSPPILYELGLISAIKWKLDQFSGLFEIRTSVTGDESNLGLSDDIRILLFRIISELVLNIVKHAQATEIQISVGKEGDQLRVSITDNGKTPNTYNEQSPLQGNEGLGMFLIKERLDSLQGSLILETPSGQKNRVSLLVPI